MPSYAIIGASRGIGFEFVRQLSADKNNLVFACVRSPQSSTALLELQQGASNVHIVSADLENASTLQSAAAETAKITGGSLDYLINNGATLYTEHPLCTLLDLTASDLEKDLASSFHTNVVGVANAINAFLPLLRKGTTKKVISLSTGIADTDVVIKTGFAVNAQYAISKAALNMLVAEFAAALQPEGFTFLAISPGVVNTALKPPTAEEIEGFKGMVAQFRKYSPEWNGVPLAPETSVKMMRDVIAKVGPKDSGAFISHFGNKKWL